MEFPAIARDEGLAGRLEAALPGEDEDRVGPAVPRGPEAQRRLAREVGRLEHRAAGEEPGSGPARRGPIGDTATDPQGPLAAVRTALGDLERHGRPAAEG